MLSNLYPFDGSGNVETFKAIKNCSFKFPDMGDSHMDMNSKDLISKLLGYFKVGPNSYSELKPKKEETKNKGVKVCKFQSAEFTNRHLQLYEKMGFNFIISNFTQLDENVKKVFQLYSNKYSLLEHDHKYIASNNPSLYKDFLAPEQQIINKFFGIFEFVKIFNNYFE